MALRRYKYLSSPSPSPFLFLMLLLLLVWEIERETTLLADRGAKMLMISASRLPSHIVQRDGGVSTALRSG